MIQSCDVDVELLNDSPKLNNDAPMEQHKTMLDSDFLTKIKLIAHHYRVMTIFFLSKFIAVLLLICVYSL